MGVRYLHSFVRLVLLCTVVVLATEPCKKQLVRILVGSYVPPRRLEVRMLPLTTSTSQNAELIFEP